MNNSDNINFKNEMSHKDFEELLEILKKQNLFINNLSNEIVINFFNSKFFLQLDDPTIKSIFLRANNDIKLAVLNNKEICKRILLLPPNNSKRYCFDLIDSEIQLKILSYGKELNKFEDNLYEKLISHLDDNIFFRFINKLNLSQDDEAKALITLQKKYNINENSALEFLQKVKQKTRNYYMYIKINNQLQFYIYNKFNIFVKFKVQNENEIFLDDTLININFLKALNGKHICSIIEKLNKISNDLTNEKILLLAIKLYCIFGYDNTISIINNKFTYMTDSALSRAANTNFVNTRRVYRLEHQNKFYSNDMIKNTLKALETDNLDFFRNICFDNSNSYISSVIAEINEKLKELTSLDEKKQFLTFYMKNEIKKREENFKRKFIANFIQNYSLSHQSKRNAINAKELYLLFKEVDLNIFQLDDNGRIILDNDLIIFLLGNLKKDNDALLRLIFNKEALGLNNAIDLIINNFDVLRSVINRSNELLSLYSILDVMEISKAIFFNLAPDEQEINLSTISKIMHSLEHIINGKNQDYRVNAAKRLYLKQKEKTASSIPYIKGISRDGIKFSIGKFDDPNLLTSGIDAGNCLKIGAIGEDFLKYCLTSPHAAIIKIYDDNTSYICPIIRNGNGIYGNGIDPKPKNSETAEKIINALKECYEKLIGLSDCREKIEFCSITDLHIPDFFAKQELDSIKLTENLAINSNFYSDFYKDGSDGLNEKVTSYILTKNQKYTDPHYYEPKILYYQPRIPNYIYNINCEIDKEKLEQQINSIYYNSINQKDVYEEEKNSLRRNYKNLSVDDFNYIIGNKDWFIAIDKNYNIISICLPYDKRAMDDYLKAFSEIKENFANKENESDFKK